LYFVVKKYVSIADHHADKELHTDLWSSQSNWQKVPTRQGMAGSFRAALTLTGVFVLYFRG
jgi:hypothetical protein